MTGTRIDVAHVLGDGPATAPEALAPSTSDATGATETGAALSDAAGPTGFVSADNPAPIWTEDLLARLRVQGRQLADRLRERQSDLDRREANSHARSAELENEVRSARLWLIEREQELAERESRLADAMSRLSAAEAYQESARRELAAESDRREEGLARREQALATATARHERQNAALADAQREIESRRQREHQTLVEERQQLDRHRQTTLQGIRLALVGVEQRRAAIEQQAAELENQRKAVAAAAQLPSEAQRQHARDLQTIADRLAAREAALDESESLLHWAEVERDAMRSQLQEELQRLQAQAQIEQRRMADQRRAADELAARQQEAMRQTQAQLDQRQESLNRLRDELTVIHREALETRAAADEALARLFSTETAEHAAITKALKETKQKLHEQWQIAASRGEAEQAELTALGQQVAKQLQTLRAQKLSLERSTSDRERTFTQQADALAERESGLRAREAQLRDERDNWSRERAVLEQRLRTASDELTRWSRSGECPLSEE
jgi:hypothetical protein